MTRHYTNILRSAALALTLMFGMEAMAQETVTTVADKGTSGKFFAKLCPTKDVAISKDDADVFSIYMDMGIAYFSKLRVRSGMFVIKAGEPVIVKTSEAKTITLGTSDKPSSTFFSDVICLSADKAVADYRKENSVKDDEFIYMLTNKAENGGFGFTKFTGTTMKAGNFYIISTIAPPASGRLETVWLDEDGNVLEDNTTGIQNVKKTVNKDVIYSLAGQKVDASYKGIVIKNGKKFVQE